jgi:ATP-binding cassette subfamily B protein RaxB
MQAPLLKILGSRTTPVVRQVENAECGLACVAMIAGYHGYNISLAELRQRFSVSLRGSTVSNIVHWAAALKLGARALRCEIGALKKLSLPAILHWRFNHFVVLDRIGGDSLTIIDPATGQRKVRWDEVNEAFTGIAIEFAPAADFITRKAGTPLKLLDLIKLSRGEVRLAWQLIVTTLAIQVALLLAPLFSQVAIDQAIVRGDPDFLLTLLIGFIAVKVFECLTGGFRSLVLQTLTNVLGFGIQTSLLHHMMRLPLEYFQKRPVGEIQMRFQSVNTIRQTLVGGGIGFVTDVLLTIIPAGILLAYEPALGGFSLGLIALAMLIKVGFLQVSRRLTGDLITMQAREQTLFLENIRGMSSIKATSAEEVREGQWRNLLVDVTNAQLRLGNVDTMSANLVRLATGIGDLIVVYWACKGVMSANWTLGMMMAFLAYRSQVVQHGLAMIDFIMQAKLLEVHVGRVADIALSPRETLAQHLEDHDGEIDSISLRGVGFRYGPQDPVILNNVNMTISKGEIVAVSGPSGCGKSTMISILAGLYKPTYGEILINGNPVSAGRLVALRKGIGTVLQDDRLFIGSIAENISLFDERMDMERVIAAAKSAAIHEEIQAMPMGYRSPVGDMGSALSGGQRQRVMIARALYRNPWLVILDEGTAQLDLGREKSVMVALREQGLACLVVSHRPQTVMYADRLLEMKAGTLVEAPILPAVKSAIARVQAPLHG